MPYSTVGGYGTPSVNPDGSALVDTEDGTPVFGPMFNLPTSTLPSGTLITAAGSFGPGLSATPGIPIMNALLIEMRILNDLVNRANNNLDLGQMRADELFNTTIGSGAL